MTTISKNVYFDVLNDIVDEYNNIYHRTIKMKPIDVKSNSFAEYKEETSGIKWSVLAHLESQPRGQNFQAQI